MGAQVFERKELKYIITKAQRDAMLDLMSGYMRPDKYGVTTICNIYFDTPNHRLIRSSIEKPLYKEKLRLRTYGVPNDDTPAFAELKKKFKGIVYKRRETLPYAEAFDFLSGRGQPSLDTQVIKEIDWTVKNYEGLRPAMALFYDRVAYEGCEDPELRMTLDTNLVYRTYDLDLRKGAYGEVFMDGDHYILEIKILNSMPLWMAEVLDKLCIYPGSYSKYGAAYTKDLIEGVN